MTTYGCGLYAPAPKRWLPARRAALAGEWRVGDLEPAGLHFVLRVPRNTTLVQKQRLRKCEKPENKFLPLPLHESCYARARTASVYVESLKVCAPSQTRSSGIRTRLPDGRGDRKRCARPGRDEIRAGFSWN